MVDSEAAVDLIETIIRLVVIRTISQTFIYGIYFCLFPISIYAMVTKGLQTRSRKWLFAMTTSMFMLSSVHWAMSMIATIIEIDAFLSQLGPVPRNPPYWPVIIGAFANFNYIITDGVVVWRAWVLCSDQNRGILMSRFLVIMLVINTVIYLFIVAERARFVIVLEAGRESTILIEYINNLLAYVNLVLSLLINIFATSIIAVKAWKYRKTLMTSGVGIRTPTRGIRILALVVESGMLYIFIGVVNLVSIFIHLPFGTLSKIVMPLASQLAGLYPIVVLLLVETNRSLDTTYFSCSSIIDARAGQRSEIGLMNFAVGPVHATGSQMEIGS